MTYGTILRACLLCLTNVGHVLAASLAGHSQATTYLTTEHASFTSPISSDDIVDTHLPPIIQPPTDQEALRGFEGYIAGLVRLSEALQDTGRNWEAVTHIPFDESSQLKYKTDFKDQVQKLFAFAGTMERLIGEIKQNFPENDETVMQDNIMLDDPALVSNYTEVASAKNLHALITTVTDLLTLFDQYFGRESVNDVNDNGEEMKEEKMDGIQILADILESLAEAHTNYSVAISALSSPVMENSSTGYTERISNSTSLPLNSSSSVNPQGNSTIPANNIFEPGAAWRPLGWLENQRGLLQVAAQLKTLLGPKAMDVDGSDTVPSSTPKAETVSTTTTTTVTPRRKDGTPRHQPCLPPFDQIAYRMCILQEMELKLTWSDAQEFCREHGAKLAQDMTVIKMRRLLNDLYGEEGTRSRWPVWVGARRGREQWQWSGLAEGSGVSSFLWAPNEPRVYSSDLLPEGACMILDGYRRFHAASLPCHLRRRFVCEL